jgi:DNA-binding PucR family transcriptional regulator
VLTSLPSHTLVTSELADLEGQALLLVPDVPDRRRPALLRALLDRGAVAGPDRPWLEVRSSYQRALRARALDLTVDTETHLTELVLQADPDALADLRAQVLAPLAGLRPATAEKLTDTLRSWLLHHGRREEVAAELFVHPQTVRYRMGQLRELYGERLDDPDQVLALTVALGADRS